MGNYENPASTSSRVHECRCYVFTFTERNELRTHVATSQTNNSTPKDSSYRAGTSSWRIIIAYCSWMWLRLLHHRQRRRIFLQICIMASHGVSQRVATSQSAVCVGSNEWKLAPGTIITVLTARPRRFSLPASEVCRLNDCDPHNALVMPAVYMLRTVSKGRQLNVTHLADKGGNIC